MPQIFSPAADTWFRLALVLTAFLIVAAGLLIGGTMTSSYATLVGWPQSQPVPFSHEHHVGGLGIDCRYCHTTVETSPHAGLPPTHVCMTCHSQIWTDAPMLAPVRESLASGQPIPWVRVARVPDYVFFNHSIHIARGVPCAECHGRVDRMPLTYRAEPFRMSWCLDCHRDPAPHLRPPDQVTRMDWSGWGRTDADKAYGAAAMKAFDIHPATLVACNVCHR
ncbi:cytochrome c3 family protein [Inquilinus limosus]|uniref:Cytochrome C n=1 Tax=Inquilinus limosus MP06 TaxID=1398085 RepID=A0A0A0DAM4_9PROT|nr:cytochrome c3 family protein [Inquilinus limosus]KGM35756.1 cytochrome C [Inquilinus limosus MP06]